MQCYIKEGTSRTISKSDVPLCVPQLFWTQLQVRKQLSNYIIIIVLYFTAEASIFSQVKHIILQLHDKIGARQQVFPALFNCWQSNEWYLILSTNTKFTLRIKQNSLLSYIAPNFFCVSVHYPAIKDQSTAVLTSLQKKLSDTIQSARETINVSIYAISHLFFQNSFHPIK